MKRNTLTIIMCVTGIMPLFWGLAKGDEMELIKLSGKYETHWARKDEFSEFSNALKLPLAWPTALVINGDYLYALDFSKGIQILEIDSWGRLSPKHYFGKEYKALKVVYTTKQGLAVKGDYLYVADSGNHRLQVLTMNSDGSLIPHIAFGGKGKGLGEFFSPAGLAVKGDYLYVADSGNHRLQVLTMNSDGSLIPHIAFGGKGKGLGEFFSPAGLAVKGDYLYVGDNLNARIQVLEIKY
jgi:hypothetical protein